MTDPMFPKPTCGLCPHYSYFDHPVDGVEGWCTLLCRAGRRNQRLDKCPLTSKGQQWALQIAREILKEARSQQSQNWLALWAGRPVLKLLIVPIDIFATLLWLAERGDDETTLH